MLSQNLAANIENDFNFYLTLFPERIAEIKNIADSFSKELRVFFMKAVTQMPVTDIISVDFKDVLQHVVHIHKIVNDINYCKNIPIDIILNYVLPYRVNDEDFSLYSTYFYKELDGLIDKDSIEKSALEINYWCYSKATYAQADDRTQNAMTTVRAGKGRCGEESVLLVSALRSAGIPSRQCYSPYWSHCDDNHAWVEIFTKDKWEFMGSCEPEEKLNIGWFNNAASRALVIRHRIFSLDRDRLINNDQNNIFASEISTNIYSKTRTVSVNVTNKGIAVPYAHVCIYIINYCMPKSVLEKTSDDRGRAVFEVGAGDFLLYAHIGKKYDIKICKQNEQSVTLDISAMPECLEFNLIPYEGDISGADFEASDFHKRKMTRLLAERTANHSCANNSESSYLQKAQLNGKQIESFLNDANIAYEDKKAILDTLTKKDFADITLDALLDMSLALEYKSKFDSDIFNKYLLPLRVENEPVYAYKEYVKKFFEVKKLTQPNEIINYMLSSIKALDNYAYAGLAGDIKGVLKNGIATSLSIPIHIVQVFRALGIPSRLNPLDRTAEYYNSGNFVAAGYETAKSSKLKFVKKSQKNIFYGEDFTVCSLDDGYFNPLNMTEDLEKSDEVRISDGIYAFTQSSRQIDGSVVGNLKFILLNKDEKMQVFLNEPANNTKEKLKSINIDEEIINENGKVILGYIENGNEPTEHFLNELLENRNKLKNLGIKVILKGKSKEKNNILSEVSDKKVAEYADMNFTKEWKQLRKDMGIGDLRLPFITAVSDKKGLFSFANYNVGTVDLLIKILE